MEVQTILISLGGIYTIFTILIDGKTISRTFEGAKLFLGIKK